MALRQTDIDISEQKAAHEEALGSLSDALIEVAAEAKSLSKVAARGRPVDLIPFYALVQTVKKAEERCDITALDIQTALGEDA